MTISYSTKCSVDGCEKTFYSKGMCRNHYQSYRLKFQQKPCAAEGCENNNRTTSRYCAMHASRLRIHGSLDKPVRVPKPKREPKAKVAKPCAIDGCQNTTFGKVCAKHRYRMKKHGQYELPEDRGDRHILRFIASAKRLLPAALFSQIETHFNQSKGDNDA